MANSLKYQGKKQNGIIAVSIISADLLKLTDSTKDVIGNIKSTHLVIPGQWTNHAPKMTFVKASLRLWHDYYQLQPKTG